MKIKKISKFDKAVREASDLFDPEVQRKTKESIMKHTFKDQDKIAMESDIFSQILQSEISDDPEKRYKQTNSPKSKTRNALLSMGAYVNPNTKGFDKEAWEENLRTNPFYGFVT